MRAWRIVLIAVMGALILGGAIYLAVLHYGTYTYQWKTNLNSYKTYSLLGDSTLEGYIKADGQISVYILTRENFEKMKRGGGFRVLQGMGARESSEIQEYQNSRRRLRSGCQK